ncbi:MAG: hypothetical protein HDS08_00610 [Bacteroides sp.]|nr:hypothetical protein [Bacteroides sp.]
MELIEALNVVTLMTKREAILDIRSGIISGQCYPWSFVVNDTKFPIPNEAKEFFAEAIEKALDHFESEIEKL